jgi:CRISPR-associated protein Csb1
MTILTKELLQFWASNTNGPVALHLKQKLTSVECVDEKDRCIIYPPTYADIGYNIDILSDGKKVALVDSVGSQANRMEPLFKSTSEKREDWLVPQIQIALTKGKKKSKSKKDVEAAITDEGSDEETTTQLSLLDLAHRGADAVVHSSGQLAIEIKKAFSKLRATGDAEALCAIAPTSLVFGVWDSRGSSEKRPRLVRSIIRAWDVEVLHTAAQFNSVWKELDEKDRDELTKESAKKGKPKLSVVGLHDAPAVFRDTKASQYFQGAPNPEARVLGGVLVHGEIERTVTINLVALRGLQGSDGPEGMETKAMRTYLLSLALMAATKEMDLFLREGCHLRYADNDKWSVVPRRGEVTDVTLDPKVFKNAAEEGAKHFRAKWPKEMNYTFNVAEAKNLLTAKEEDEQPKETP